MIIRAAFLCLAFSISSASAEPAKWSKSVDIDDFDDTNTFISTVTASGQGSLTVRYHESTPKDYEVFWVLPSINFMTCGDSGDWMDHSGWRNIQVRVDGGKVLSLTGIPSTSKKAAFLADGSTDTLEGLVQSLKSAKKIVIRVKDKCHDEGQSWFFSKFEEILGPNHLSGIQ